MEVLKGKDFKRGNPYVILGLTNDYLNSMTKTRVHLGNEDPEWNEQFNLYVVSPRHQSLEIWVQNATSVCFHDFK